MQSGTGEGARTGFPNASSPLHDAPNLARDACVSVYLPLDAILTEEGLAWEREGWRHTRAPQLLEPIRFGAVQAANAGLRGTFRV